MELNGLRSPISSSWQEVHMEGDNTLHSLGEANSMEAEDILAEEQDSHDKQCRYSVIPSVVCGVKACVVIV